MERAVGRKNAPYNHSNNNMNMISMIVVDIDGYDDVVLLPTSSCHFPRFSSWLLLTDFFVARSKNSSPPRHHQAESSSVNETKARRIG